METELEVGTVWDADNHTPHKQWIVADIIDDNVYYTIWEPHKGKTNFNYMRRLPLETFKKKFSRSRLYEFKNMWTRNNWEPIAINNKQLLIQMIDKAMYDINFLYKLSVDGRRI